MGSRALGQREARARHRRRRARVVPRIDDPVASPSSSPCAGGAPATPGGIRLPAHAFAIAFVAAAGVRRSAFARRANRRANGREARFSGTVAERDSGGSAPGGAVTFDDVSRIALAWRGVEEGMSYGTPALRVRGKLLARLRGDGDTLVVKGVGPASARG
ncbi:MULTISPECIES: hypothetical protein [pseudomallei group]|uniref:Uncharacterized protein n=1 Tax=Burkholderia pseudomallei (strain 1106a) TaxID=357348 RepID=A3NZR2_BURP0|nr:MULTISPECIES: hypothetical protein [pseudomallei group]ABM47937.1 conserved hypothetical protein [Burkholderia mallei SAVP1]ABN89988.1 conserved hypothetical protein [Burkholderia pseudomallei 1106a]AFR17494.1 hypothetical protein BPC006_I3656 [Burkholderia pseudomallei BPC006]AIW48834.1 hypothetical protein DM57_12935 [Burkholderia mallei]AOP69562.1 hypothetical protein BHL98_06985 [Burkholderia mallei]